VRPIFAYLDPGSSSMIVQMLLGGVAAVGVALKLYWRRFLRFLRIRKDDELDAETASRRGGKRDAPTVGQASNGGAPEREPVETKP
jgi:hypothetical protein